MWEIRRPAAELWSGKLGGKAILLLVVLISCMLFACGPDATDKVNDATNAAVENAVAGNVDDYETLYSTVAFSPEPYGVSWKCFSESYFPQVSYTIDKIEKTSSGYTAFVTLQSCATEELISDLALASERARSELSSPSTDPVSSGFADRAFLDLQASQPLTMRTVSLQLYYVQAADGTWTLSNEEVLLGSILGGFDGRQETV